MDRVIQGNQPWFVLVWVGSAVALVGAAALGARELDGADRWIVIAAAVVYVTGVGAMDRSARRRAREDFEPRWNRWNVVRMWCAIGVSLLLLSVLLRV